MLFRGRDAAGYGQSRSIRDPVGRRRDDPRKSREGDAPGPAELDERWLALAGPDARRAYQAVLDLAAVPGESLPFLEKHLGAKPALAMAQITQWIVDLDDEGFDVRETASRELAKAGEAAEPSLRKAVDSPSAEVRRRVERLLERLDGFGGSPERLRCAMIEVLELAGTPEARQLLVKIARESESVLAVEAKGALRRLDKRS